MRFVPPKPSYILPLLAQVSVWAGQEWAVDEPWYAKVPFDVIFWSSLGLLAGLVVQDFYNPKSWIRYYVRNWTKSFQVDWASFPHDCTPQIEWLHFRVCLRLVRAINANLSVRVIYLPDTPRSQSFVLNGDWESARVMREVDQLVNLTLATFPLKSYDGEPLGNCAWGDRLRRSGDDKDMRSISDGTQSIVEISARTWRGTQTERVLLIWPHEKSHGFGRAAILQQEELR